MIAARVLGAFGHGAQPADPFVSKIAGPFVLRWMFPSRVA